MRLSSVLLLCGLVAAVPSLSTQSLSAQTTSAPNTGSTTTASPAPQAASTPASTSQNSAPAAPLKLESLPPEPHTLTPAQIAKLREQRILQATTQLARNEAAWGPARSTPGTSLDMVEAGRKSTPQGIQITYTFQVKGFKPTDNLHLIQWPLDQNLKALDTGLSFDGQGQLICPAITQGDCLSSMQPGDAVKFSTTAARGEAIRLAVFDETTKQHAETTIIPFPLLYTGKSCQLEVMLGVKNAALVLLEGVGFPASKTIQIQATTNGENRSVSTTTSAKGQLLAAFMPVVANKTSGTTTLSYDGGPGCSPTLSFPWGEGSYHAVTQAEAGTPQAAAPATKPAPAHSASIHKKH
uniref:Lipoprotein n=1 Tax=Acidobacterium capsulatum TaxID=33075 RepID=A0A7V4XQK1_9BACT